MIDAQLNNAIMGFVNPLGVVGAADDLVRVAASADDLARGAASADDLARVAASADDVAGFTALRFSKDPSYRGEFWKKVGAWKNNKAIDPSLTSYKSDIPYAQDFKGGYQGFKELFKSGRGRTAWNNRYGGGRFKGTYVVTQEGNLRISTASPGKIKHGMLSGGSDVNLAGEFEFGWYKGLGGRKTFTIYDVNLSSGGYRPREYKEKLNYVNMFLRDEIQW